MSAAVNVNGQVFDQEHAVISVFDHGFLYGEGVYETLRTYDGRPFLFDRHMRRLRASAGMINLEVPLTDDAIAARFDDTVRAAGLSGARRRSLHPPARHPRHRRTLLRSGGVRDAVGHRDRRSRMSSCRRAPTSRA